MMAEEELPNPKAQWLWFILIASLGLLLIIYFITNWNIESDVKPGAGPDGLTYPAGAGLEVTGSKEAAPAAAQ